MSLSCLLFWFILFYDQLNISIVVLLMLYKVCIFIIIHMCKYWQALVFNLRLDSSV